MNKQEQLIANGREFTVLLAELGFHYGRICNKAGNSTEALAVFDKLLKTAGNENHCKNGHFKLQIPSQVCCCVCLVCKAAILLNSTIKSQTQESLQQILFESNRLFSQVLCFVFSLYQDQWKTKKDAKRTIRDSRSVLSQINYSVV